MSNRIIEELDIILISLKEYEHKDTIPEEIKDKFVSDLSSIKDEINKNDFKKVAAITDCISSARNLNIQLPTGKPYPKLDSGVESYAATPKQLITQIQGAMEKVV